MCPMSPTKTRSLCCRSKDKDNTEGQGLTIYLILLLHTSLFVILAFPRIFLSLDYLRLKFHVLINTYWNSAQVSIHAAIYPNIQLSNTICVWLCFLIIASLKYLSWHYQFSTSVIWSTCEMSAQTSIPANHQTILVFSHLFICAYIVWAISPLYPLLPTPPPFQAESVLPLSLILLKREYKQ
jgi:hypothetical protein